MKEPAAGFSWSHIMLRSEDAPATIMLALAAIVFLLGALYAPHRAELYGVLSAACAAGTVWYLTRSER